MNATRRGFFRSLARAAAIVALAPQLAFRAPPLKAAVEVETAIEEPVVISFWSQTERYSHCYSEEYRAALQKL